jgi:hypothetical protein
MREKGWIDVGVDGLGSFGEGTWEKGLELWKKGREGRGWRGVAEGYVP